MKKSKIGKIQELRNNKSSSDSDNNSISKFLPIPEYLRMNKTEKVLDILNQVKFDTKILNTYFKGLVAISNGDFKLAADNLETLKKARSPNLHIKYYLAFCYLKLGNKHATELFQEIYEKDPVTFKDSLNYLMMSHLIQDQVEEGCCIYEKSAGDRRATFTLREKDWLVNSIILKSRVLINQGENKPAEKLLNRLLKLNIKGEIQRHAIEMLDYCKIINAISFLKAGNSSDALDIFTEIYEKNKKNPEIIKFIAICHEKDYDFAKANIYWSKLTNFHLKSAKGEKEKKRGNELMAYAHKKMGINYLIARKKSKAAAEFRKSLKFNPDDIKLRHELTFLLLTSRRIEEAYKELDILLDLAPHDSTTYLLSGRAFTFSFDWENAFLTWKKAWELGGDLRPFNDSIWLSSFKLFTKLITEEKYNEVLNNIDLVLDWLKNDYGVKILKGAALLGAGKIRQGEDIFEKFLKIGNLDEFFYIDLTYYCDYFRLKKLKGMFIEKGIDGFEDRGKFYKYLLKFYHENEKNAMAYEIFNDEFNLLETKAEKEEFTSSIYTMMYEENLHGIRFYANKLKELHPETAYGLFTLSVVYKAEKDSRRSLECLDKAAALGFDFDDYFQTEDFI